MKLEMTERDKKLLIFLAIFVIVVCIGYWGIFPIVKDMNQIKYDTIEEEQIREMNDLKLAQLPMIEKENEEYEEDIKKAKSDFYEMMNADEIDKLFTTMALDYNLYAYSMDISMPTEQAELEAYAYSEKYLADQEQEDALEEEDATAADGKDQSDSTETDTTAGSGPDDSQYYEDKMVGIYAATIQMKLGGEEAVLQKLIDDLSVSSKQQRLVSYQWDTDSDITIDDAGNYDIRYQKVLNIVIEIYMCEE